MDPNDRFLRSDPFEFRGDSRYTESRGTGGRLKRLDLIRRLEQSGCVLLRHGGRHDIYHNPQTGTAMQVLPLPSESCPARREHSFLGPKMRVSSARSTRGVST
jgi:predicted RNA binding protein YcfA (HicA-like mRNA interferase family)